MTKNQQRAAATDVLLKMPQDFQKSFNAEVYSVLPGISETTLVSALIYAVDHLQGKLTEAQSVQSSSSVRSAKSDGRESGKPSPAKVKKVGK